MRYIERYVEVRARSRKEAIKKARRILRKRKGTFAKVNRKIKTSKRFKRKVKGKGQYRYRIYYLPTRKLIRSLIQISYFLSPRAKKKKTYDVSSDGRIAKLRIWINSDKTYDEQELMFWITSVPEMKQLYQGVKGKKVYYRVDYEQRTIDNSEAENTDVINYYLVIGNKRKYIYWGVI